MINPVLDVPPSSFSTAKVVGKYTNLRAQIDAVTALTSVDLKKRIEQLLAPIDWIIYEGQAMAYETGRITTDADLRWTELPTLSYEVTSQEISFTITPKVSARDVYCRYQVRENPNINMRMGLIVLSN